MRSSWPSTEQLPIPFPTVNTARWMTLRTPHSMSTAQTPWCRRFATCSPGCTSDVRPNLATALSGATGRPRAEVVESLDLVPLRGRDRVYSPGEPEQLLAGMRRELPQIRRRLEAGAARFAARLSAARIDGQVELIAAKPADPAPPWDSAGRI